MSPPSASLSNPENGPCSLPPSPHAPVITKPKCILSSSLQIQSHRACPRHCHRSLSTQGQPSKLCSAHSQSFFHLLVTMISHELHDISPLLKAFQGCPTALGGKIHDSLISQALPPSVISPDVTPPRHTHIYPSPPCPLCSLLSPQFSAPSEHRE